MSLALYRKYRPSTFKEVVGQEHIKITLENELKTGKIAHAYLFNGPRGTGKTTMARILAKALNCENRKEGESEPCNECASCKAINEGKSLDVIEIDAASNRGVENIQNNILNYIRLKPSNSKYKIFIIDEVHMLSAYAFNALLKTLEEPPEYVVFILATTEIHKILPTIVSRCQHFDFQKIDAITMKSRLLKLAREENVLIDDDVLDLVAHYSEGCMRDAESLLSQLLSLDSQHINLEQAQLILPRSNFEDAVQLVKYIFSNEVNNALSRFNDLIYQGIDINHFYREFILFLRQLLFIKLNLQSLIEFNNSQREELSKIIDFVSVQDLIKVINIFVALSNSYKSNLIPQLPFELALIQSVDVLFKDKQNNLKVSANNINASSSVNKQIQENTIQVNQKVDNVKKSQNSVDEKKNEIVTDDHQGKKNGRDTELVKDDVLVIFDISKLQASWLEVRNRVKKDNISLASALSVAKPELIDNQLYIKFKYEFNYKQVIKNTDFKAFIQNAIKEVLGHECDIKCEFDPSIDLDFMKNVNTANKLSLNTNTDINPFENEGSNDVADILGLELTM